MKKMIFLAFLIILVAPLFSTPYSPFPSPLLLGLDIGFAHDFYEYTFAEYIKLTADVHGNLGPEFSVYPGSLFPFLRVHGGAALSLILPFNSMLALSADTGLLINPLVDFDAKWLDLVYTAGLSGFAGVYYQLDQDVKIRFGGKILLEFFTSFVYPVPFRFYYSGELLVAVCFDL